MNLLPKILVLIVPLACAIIAVVSLLAFNFTYSLLQNSIEAEQRKDAREVFDKIDRLLYERFNDIQTVAANHVLQTIINDNNQAIDVELAQKKLEQLAIITGPWDELYIIDKNGRIYLSTDKKVIGQSILEDKDDEEVFEDALSGSIAYTDLYKENESGRPTIAFASPLRADEVTGSPVVGVVIGHLSWPVVIEALESVHNQDGSVISLVNNKGFEIASSNNTEKNILRLNISERATIQGALQGKETTVKDKSAYGEYEVVASAVPERGFLNYKGNGWIMRIETPITIAYSSAIGSAVSITLLIGPLTLAGTAIILFALSYLIRPIRSLTRTVELFSGGDLSQRAVVHSSDEFGKLAAAFNLMAETLQESQQNLEQKVAQRTQDLEGAKRSLEQNLTDAEKMNNIMVGRELKMIEMKKEIEELKKGNLGSVAKDEDETT